MDAGRSTAKAADQPVSLRKHVTTLVVLLSVALILFGSELLTSQRYVDGDEGVVGIMARHVLTRGEHPLFFYGQFYGGGGAIEAYLAAVAFALFGTSSIALKSVALCFSLITIALSYLFCMRRFDYPTAVVSSLLLISATALIEWHLKVRGGYAATPMFLMAILMSFSDAMERSAESGWRFVVLGLLCGVAYYNLEVILPFLLTLLLFSLCWRPVFWRWKSAFLTAAGFAVGSSPLLIFNLTHDFANLRYVYGQGAGQNGQSLFSHLHALLFNYLPGFFVGRNVDNYVSHVPRVAYLEYAVYISLFVCLSVKSWPRARHLAVTLVSSAGSKRTDVSADIETLLTVYLIVHVSVLSLSGTITESPRYLLPLYPALAIVAARGVRWLCAARNRVARGLGVTFVAMLLAAGFLNHSSYIGKSWVNDDVFVEGEGLVNRQTAGESASAIIDFLNRRGITRVWCTYFVQWRLLFESNEQIVASADRLIPGAETVRYPLYDAMVWREGGPQAIVLHYEDAQIPRLEQSMTTAYERARIGDYVILLPR